MSNYSPEILLLNIIAQIEIQGTLYDSGGKCIFCKVNTNLNLGYHTHNCAWKLAKDWQVNEYNKEIDNAT